MHFVAFSAANRCTLRLKLLRQWRGATVTDGDESRHEGTGPVPGELSSGAAGSRSHSMHKSGINEQASHARAATLPCRCGLGIAPESGVRFAPVGSDADA